MKRHLSRVISVVAAAAVGAAAGCTQRGASDGPGTAHQAGELQCIAADACRGALCTDSEGAATCQPLPAACNGVATCACAVGALCHDQACRELDGGIACKDIETQQDGGVGTDSGPSCVDIRARETWVFAMTGTPVQLDAEGSAPGIDAVEWAVIDRPEGSAARPGEVTPDDPRTPRAVFVPDVPGRYVLQLRSAGVAICDETTAGVELFAADPVGLAAVVRWANGDPRTPPPFWVEVHLVHPTGTPFVAPGDCGGDNPDPDWGVPGDASDDPSLGIEGGAQEGLGVITLQAMEDTSAFGHPYQVYVQYQEEWSSTGEDAAAAYPATELGLQLFWEGSIVSDVSVRFDEGTTWLPAAELYFESGVLRVVPVDPPI